MPRPRLPKTDTENRHSIQARDLEAISFRDWRQVLHASDLTHGVKWAFQRHILRFLGFCKENHVPASVLRAKAFLTSEAGSRDLDEVKAALRWFVIEGRKQSRGEVSRAHVARTREAPPAAGDVGGPEWERQLVRAIRTKGLLWRTEQTYRSWAQRFADFIAPRGVRIGRACEVRAFLTHLATTQRASFSTQRQALNALVFLYHEGLSIELGDLSGFLRAEPRRRVPVVLSRSECRRVIEALSGTSRLMTQLAYGAGLRVMELVRLRVQDVDLERGIVVVRSGKGDKDRPTPLPDSLRPALQAHLERLRVLYREDREAKRPGVWLPEGIARKFGTGIGHEWIWQWFLVASLPDGRPLSHPCAVLQGQFLTQTAN